MLRTPTTYLLPVTVISPAICNGFNRTFDNHADTFAQQDIAQTGHNTQQQWGIGHDLVKKHGKDVVEDLHNDLLKKR